MEERRDKEYIIEVTADKEQQQQAILRIAIATGIETEQIENCIAKLESYRILTEERSIYVDTRGRIQEDIRDYYCPEKLEDKGTSLEDSFNLYKQGMELLKFCSDKLDTVEKKMLQMNEDGTFSEFSR